MRLQILLNRYSENAEILGRMLHSIEEQDYSKDDYEVLIGDDGGEETLSEDFFRQFSFPLRYFSFPHRGVCATRNALLDLSDAEYIMFCDSDDEFNNKNGLSSLVKAIEENHADIIDSRFLVEQKYDDGCILSNIVMNYNIIWLQGKLFRREYIIKNKIRFPDKLKFAGDMYFLWLAFYLTDNIVRIPNIFYTWKWYEKSITRNYNPEHRKEAYTNTVLCYALLIENLMERDRQDLVQFAVTSLFSKLYLDYKEEQYLEYRKEIIFDIISRFYSIYTNATEELRRKQFVLYLKKVPDNEKETEFQKVLPWVKEIINKPA